MFFLTPQDQIGYLLTILEVMDEYEQEEYRRMRSMYPEMFHPPKEAITR